ncbi:MAG: HPP family protein [Pseudomonadota bacterium]
MKSHRLSLSHWLAGFIPQPLHTHPREWTRAGIGAALGVLCSALLCRQLYGDAVMLHLLGPVGASAVLLFAVPSGALAQPWSILGGYLTAGLVALLAQAYLGPSLGSASLAAGLALILMCPLRCLHPPAAGVALAVVLSEPASRLGAGVLAPVLLNALCLLGSALLYNNLTGVRYPKHQGSADPQPHHTRDLLPQQRLGITPADLDRALSEIGEFVDVTREDLDQLIRATEKHALRRSMGEIHAAQIMSRDVQCATPYTTVEQALRLLTHHHLKSLPVLNASGLLVGIVSLIDLLGHARPRTLLGRLGLQPDKQLEQLMSSPVTCVDSHTHVLELIPLLSDQGLHCLPVLERGRLVGIVTQTDLIAALHRDLLLHLA